jgi:hypothetical protein
MNTIALSCCVGGLPGLSLVGTAKIERAYGLDNTGKQGFFSTGFPVFFNGCNFSYEIFFILLHA